MCLPRASSRRKAASRHANAARQEQPQLPANPATFNHQGPRLPQRWCRPDHSTAVPAGPPQLSWGAFPVRRIEQSAQSSVAIGSIPASIDTRVSPELVAVATDASSDLNPEAPVFTPQATPPQVSQRWKPKEKRRGVKGSLARAEKRLLNPEVQARAEQYKQSFNVQPSAHVQ